MQALYSLTPVKGFSDISRTDFQAPLLSEYSTRSMPLMWKATTPTVNFAVTVWFGTTSHRAIALAPEPGPVPTADGWAVAFVKPVPATRTGGGEPGGSEGAGSEGAGSGSGTGAGGASAGSTAARSATARCMRP